MGKTIGPISLESFVDEFEKIADWRQNTLETAKRFLYPIQGMKKGWRSLSPTMRLIDNDPAMLKSLQKTQNINKLEAEGTKLGPLQKLRKYFGTGEHLAPEAQPPKNLTQAMAENFSRAGWTGTSRVSKYLPVGDKSQLVLLGPGLSAPGIIQNMQDPNRGVGEEAGSALGFLGGSVLAAGAGTPGFIASMAAGHYAGKLGKKVDEFRHPVQAPTYSEVT